MAQYGIKEVMNMVVCEYNPVIEEAKPIVVLDYCQVSDVQNQAERLDIQGGRGNKKLLSFDHSKIATLPITIPLVDMKMLSILSGDDIEYKVQKIFKKEVLTVTTLGHNKVGVELKKTPIQGTIFVNKLEGFRDFGEALNETTSDAPVAGEYLLDVNKVVVDATDCPLGSELIVCYTHSTTKAVETMSFNPEKFARPVTLKGDSLFRNQYTEEDEVYNFIAYKGRFQMNYTLSMNATSATVLETVLDLYAYKDKESQTEKYYEWIKEEDKWRSRVIACNVSSIPNLPVGQTFQLVATPVGVTYSVQGTTRSSQVVSVTDDGLVTAISEGSANIIISHEDCEDVIIPVTVEAAPSEQLLDVSDQPSQAVDSSDEGNKGEDSDDSVEEINRLRKRK